ncbi:hypothetical protein [Mycolicibacterium sp. HS_4_1]
MFRVLTVAAAIAGTAIGLAPFASADPALGGSDDPGRYPTDVPGMNYQAVNGAPCDSHDIFIFGRGPGGASMACHWIPNQWPPVDTGFWGYSYAIQGVKDIGSPCPGPQTAAQAPDGRPLLCLGAQGWQPGFKTGDGFFPS